MRPSHSVRPKIRLTASGNDLITILRCFLSFKAVVTARNINFFKTINSLPKNGHPSRARSLVPRTASLIMAETLIFPMECMLPPFPYVPHHQRSRRRAGRGRPGSAPRLSWSRAGCFFLMETRTAICLFCIVVTESLRCSREWWSICTVIALAAIDSPRRALAICVSRCVCNRQRRRPWAGTKL